VLVFGPPFCLGLLVSFWTILPRGMVILRMTQVGVGGGCRAGFVAAHPSQKARRMGHPALNAKASICKQLRPHL
jgi:hypothetical protein